MQRVSLLIVSVLFVAALITCSKSARGEDLDLVTQSGLWGIAGIQDPIDVQQLGGCPLVHRSVSYLCYCHSAFHLSLSADEAPEDGWLGTAW